MINEKKNETMNLPYDKYSIIYADPPWHYDTNMHDTKTSTGGAHSHYETMSLGELKELDVRGISDDDCLLFMWAVSPLLNIALEVGDSWGLSTGQLVLCGKRSVRIQAHIR